MAADPLALAAATMAATSCRPANWSRCRRRGRRRSDPPHRETKTRAAKRTIPIAPAFQPILRVAALQKTPVALLLAFEPERVRSHKDETKAKLDALRRACDRCAAAGVQWVVSHSLRGLNATLHKTSNATEDSITRALGHVDISTTRAQVLRARRQS